MNAYPKATDPDSEVGPVARVYNIEGIKTFNLKEWKSVTYEKGIAGEDRGRFY